MPGLAHDFLLLSRDEFRSVEYTKFIHDPRAVQIHDDFLRYIGDTLSWIPTVNATVDTEERGFCLHGATVLLGDGAVIAFQVFEAWRKLLSCGPRRIQLTGGWMTVEGSASHDGEYEQLQFDRDELVKRLDTLKDWARAVSDSKGSMLMLHVGV